MFNRTLNRPMFRRGGSTGSQGTGITSGLQAPRQGYDGDGDTQQVKKFDTNQNIAEFLKNASIGDQQKLVKQLYPEKPRNNKDLFIDFGLDLVSRPGSGGSIFENIGASGQTAYNKYRTANTAADDKLDDRRSGMFTSLIEGQSDILGSDGGAKSYRDLEIARALEKLIPEIYAIQAKVDNGTASEDDLIQLDVLKTKKNNFTKSNVVTDATIELFSKSPTGQNYFNTVIGDLLKKDRDSDSPKYPGATEDNPSVELLRDVFAEIKRLLGSFSTGGRAGYANGELVEEQVTETMVPGSMGGGQDAGAPISYDQLRARLPQEISDDIVQLMSNSAEALEDFAMISTQQEVDQFNQRYSVNLVLPAGA